MLKKKIMMPTFQKSRKTRGNKAPFYSCCFILLCNRYHQHFAEFLHVFGRRVKVHSLDQYALNENILKYDGLSISA